MSYLPRLFLQIEVQDARVDVEPHLDILPNQYTPAVHKAERLLVNNATLTER